MNRDDNEDFIYSDWKSLDNQVDALGDDIDTVAEITERLLIDLKFLQIMFEEDMI